MRAALLLSSAQAEPLRQTDHGVQKKGHDAQKEDGHDEPVELERLTGVDDEISQSFPGCQELPDDHAHQAEADVDLHGADKGRDGAGDHGLSQSLDPCAPQGADELQLLRVHAAEGGVEGEDAPEDGHGHAGHDDGPCAGSQPDDEERGQGGFGQAVEDNHVGVQHLREARAKPEDDRRQHADGGDQEEACDCLQERHPHMAEDAAVPGHTGKAEGDLRGAAEDEGVDDPPAGTVLPQGQKTGQEEDPGRKDGGAARPLPPQVEKLGFGYAAIHCCSVPSR